MSSFAARPCSILYPPSNGHLTVNNAHYRGVAQYFCNNGYNLVGASNRTCQSSGHWSGTPPRCRREWIELLKTLYRFDLLSFSTAVSCPIPMSPTNGTMSYTSTQYGGIVDYSCDSLYRLIGAYKHICQADGMWSDLQPSCESKASGWCLKIIWPTHSPTILITLSMHMLALPLLRCNS